MVGRLDRWLPVSGDAAFFEASVADVVGAFEAQFDAWDQPISVEAVDDPFPEVFRRLEPIDGTRMLLVPDGDWTALFHGGVAPDLSTMWSVITERLGSRSVLAAAAPNVYGRGKGANTSVQYADPSVSDEDFGVVRTITLGYAERGWEFDTDGEPQAWEDLSAYEARRPVDRLPPALVHRYLDAIGIPPLDGPGWGPGGMIVTRLPLAPPKRGLFGRRRPDPAAEEESDPASLTIAALHEQMYGDME